MRRISLHRGTALRQDALRQEGYTACGDRNTVLKGGWLTQEEEVSLK